MTITMTRAPIKINRHHEEEVLGRELVIETLLYPEGWLCVLKFGSDVLAKTTWPSNESYVFELMADHLNMHRESILDRCEDFHLAEIAKKEAQIRSDLEFLSALPL